MDIPTGCQPGELYDFWYLTEQQGYLPNTANRNLNEGENNNHNPLDLEEPETSLGEKAGEPGS